MRLQGPESRSKSARPDIGSGLQGRWYVQRRSLLATGSTALALLAGRGVAARAKEMPSAAGLVRPGDSVYGNPRGAVTIVDFYDLRCPPCRAMDVRIGRLLAADPAVRYVPIDYPILGAASLLGAEALLAARLQGKYKPLRARLMAEKEPPTMRTLRAAAKAVGLDWIRLEFDMNGDRVAAMLGANMRLGRAAGVRGTPTLFIDRTRVNGALSYADLLSEVERAERPARLPFAAGQVRG